MAKKRFNLMDTMEEVNSFIQSSKERKTENGVDEINESNGLNKSNEPIRTEEQTIPSSAPETKTESGVGEYDPTVPDTKYKRNITLSEEMLWRLNYIKDRRNKSRTKGEKFTSIDQLMFEMVQQVLDERYPDTKKKFINNYEF